MSELQNLGKVGRIKYVHNGIPTTHLVERSTGRNIGFKTDKALHKNIKQTLDRYAYLGYPVVSVEILEVSMVATSSTFISEGDL